jgi:hypothetical protein
VVWPITFTPSSDIAYPTDGKGSGNPQESLVPLDQISGCGKLRLAAWLWLFLGPQITGGKRWCDIFRIRQITIVE